MPTPEVLGTYIVRPSCRSLELARVGKGEGFRVVISRVFLFLLGLSMRFMSCWIVHDGEIAPC